MKSFNVVVVIPTYKPVEQLKGFEEYSIRQTISVLSEKFPIAIMGKNKSEIKAYSKRFQYSFISKVFNLEDFQNINSYNNLLKSSRFYLNFLDYSHIWIIQTDALVFSSEINEFLHFDFIGAPWFSNVLKNYKQGLCGGNGGFSIRAVNSALETLNRTDKMLSLAKTLELSIENGSKKKPKSIFTSLISAIKHYKHQNYLTSEKNQMPFIYEDVFWALIVPSVVKSFRVPSGNVSLKFAFEMYPKKAYKINNYQLPIGCHAFDRYDPDFWTDKVPELKRVLSI